MDITKQISDISHLDYYNDEEVGGMTPTYFKQNPIKTNGRTSYINNNHNFQNSADYGINNLPINMNNINANNFNLIINTQNTHNNSNRNTLSPQMRSQRANYYKEEKSVTKSLKNLQQSINNLDRVRSSSVSKSRGNESNLYGNLQLVQTKSHSLFNGNPGGKEENNNFHHSPPLVKKHSFGSISNISLNNKLSGHQRGKSQDLKNNSPENIFFKDRITFSNGFGKKEGIIYGDNQVNTRFTVNENNVYNINDGDNENNKYEKLNDIYITGNEQVKKRQSNKRIETDADNYQAKIINSQQNVAETDNLFYQVHTTTFRAPPSLNPSPQTRK